MSRELDVQMAELMGWQKRFYIPDRFVWVDEMGVVMMTDVKWQPSTDIAAAMQVEERIKELGLIGKYCKHLNDIANAYWDAGKRQGRSWQLIHATSEDRCRAAVLAKEAE